VVLYPNVVSFIDHRFGCCDLLWRGVIHHGTGKASAMREPGMTRERDERMWNLAYRLAQSGEHRNCQAIEWELQAFGYSRARQLLYPEQVRERLDGICAEARNGFVSG
jgi:hypothetical protein